MGAVNILAQVAPAATTETTLYQSEVRAKALCQEIVVCNRSGSPSSFRVSVSLNGALTAAKDYLYYNTPINGNDTLAVELGLTINAFDIVRVYASSGDLTFTMFGNPT